MNDSRSSSNVPVIIVVLVLIALLAGFIYWYNTRQTEPEPVTAAPTAPVPAVPAPAPKPEPAPEPEPEPQPAPEPEVVEPPAPEPIPEPKVELPPLNESDDFVAEQLQSDIQKPELLNLVVPEEVVRKTVRAVIGVSENRLVNQYRPVLSPLPTMGITQTAGGPEPEYRLTEENYQRYNKHIALMQSVEPATLAATYRSLEPMFEEAYAEQGLEGSFRDALLQAVDNLLATPDVEGPFTLKRPAVMYKYADPELEALPEPQKLMLRIGPDNREKVEAYLREFKRALEAQ
ncbi:DUF3014 domain-containing protein [Gilvimarinus algae]|uniref:DUF3014 domain-containing protein n=1 Tax=Gilvimarinus algae TaxID=3058037 RepID=A0ABT8TCW1_9GAMM|nr:DUF3014 domain-containing protein [Gilvimarinus sp. SDUM040014]MDO3381934.1 DUF3014 domain-containing protein [Gilvimarinus sp. SDUM040014]